MSDKVPTGTCTDVNESIEAKLEAKQTREQLLSVIAHSHVTIFTVDHNRCITMLEGALIWDSTYEQNNSRWYIGQNVDDVFNRLNSQLPAGDRPQFLKGVEGILTGKRQFDDQEHDIGL